MLLDTPGKTGNSSQQVALKVCFTATFKDIDQIKANKFLSIHVPEHKMKKSTASFIGWHSVT